MFKAFHWTCSKSRRAGLISLLVSIAEVAVPQGEQLWGLYMATCTKGRPWANLVPGVWVEGGKGMVHSWSSTWGSHDPRVTFLITLTTDGCAE